MTNNILCKRPLSTLLVLAGILALILLATTLLNPNQPGDDTENAALVESGSFKKQQTPEPSPHWYNELFYYPKTSEQVAHERYEYLRHQKSFRQLASKTNAPGKDLDDWENIGPFGIIGKCPNSNPSQNFSGRVISLAHDRNPNVLYLGAASGGLWKSIDGGTSWMNLLDDLPDPSVGTIATHLFKRGHVWIGTGNKGNGAPGIPSQGFVYRSTNGGATWDRVHFTEEQVNFVSKIIVRAVSDEDIPGVVFIATDRGVFRSEDGVSWEKVLTGSFSDIVYSSFLLGPDYSVVAAEHYGDGLWYSDNKGLADTWQARRLPQINEPLGRISLTSSVVGLHSKVYANVALKDEEEDKNTWAGVWRSDDSGNNWNKVTRPVRGRQMNYNNTISVSNHNGNIVYTGTDSRKLFISIDGGISWTASDRNPDGSHNEAGVIHEDQQFILNFAFNRGVYVANDGGVYRTSNGGRSFEGAGNHSLALAQIYNLTVSPELGGQFDGRRYYIGTQDNGLQRGPDEFLQWEGLTCCDGGDIAFKDGLHYSTLIGLSPQSNNRIQHPPDPNVCQPWVSFADGLPPRHPWRSQLIYNGEHFFANWASALWRAENGVLPWRKVEDFGAWITRIAVSPENLLVVGLDADEPVRISTSNSRFETPSNPRSFWQNKRVTDIDLGDVTADGRRIFMTLSGTGGRRVVMSADGGGTFIDITGDLPALINARTLLVDPNDNNIIYIGSDLGVFYTWNSGINWANFSQNLPSVSYVNDLEYDPYLNEIVAATYGRGVFIVNPATSVSAEDEPTIPLVPALDLEVYPNPVADQLHITVEQAGSGFVELHLYDMNGRIVKTLSKERGTKKVLSLDVSGLAAGVYLLRGSSGRETATAKIIKVH